MRLNNSKVLNELYQFNYKDINMSAVNLDLTEFINGLDNWSGMYYYDGYLYILDSNETGINYKINLETKETIQLSYTFNSDIIENGYYDMIGFCENHVLVMETLDNKSFYTHILTLGEDIIDTPINIISDKGYDINDLYPDNMVADADNKDIIYCSTLMFDDNGSQIFNDILYKIDVKNGTMESMHMDIEEPVKKISGDFNFAYFSHGRLKVVYNIDKYIIFYEYSEVLNKFYEVDRIIGSYDGFNCTHYIDNHIMIDYRLNEFIGVLIYDLHTHEKYLTPRLVNNIPSVSFVSSKLLVDRATGGIFYYLNKDNDLVDKEYVDSLLSSAIEVVQVDPVESVLTLTTNKYQKTLNMVDRTQIVLPEVNKFTEIHLYFDANEDMVLTFPDNCKLKTYPIIEAGKSYEIVATYNTIYWLVDIIAYNIDTSKIIWYDNKEIHSNTGLVETREGYISSDFILLEDNKDYQITVLNNTDSEIYCYDDEKNYLSDLDVSESNYTARHYALRKMLEVDDMDLSNTKYIRIESEKNEYINATNANEKIIIEEIDPLEDNQVPLLILDDCKISSNGARSSDSSYISIQHIVLDNYFNYQFEFLGSNTTVNYYDEGEVFISRDTGENDDNFDGRQVVLNSDDFPEGTKYVRIRFMKNDTITFENIHEYLKVTKTPVVSENVMPLNWIDKTNLDGTTGEPYSHDAVTITDFIEIDDSYYYTITLDEPDDVKEYYYNSNKEFISRSSSNDISTGNEVLEFPEGTKYIRLKSDTDKYTIDIVKERITLKKFLKKENFLYSFGLLSDVHIDNNYDADYEDKSMSDEDYKNALRFLEDEGANFIAYCGDMTTNNCNAEADYQMLAECLKKSNIPNYIIKGNHDAGAGYFDEYVSGVSRFTVPYKDDLFIFIGNGSGTGKNAGMTQSRVDYIRSIIEDNPDRRLFLMYHQFIRGYGSGDGTGGLYSGSTLGDDPNNALTNEFIELVTNTPNLIYCHGHSHIRFNMQDTCPTANYYHADGKCHDIHVPSCARPRILNNESGGLDSYYEGSEGYMVDVYSDKVIFKAINFTTNRYMPEYNQVVNLAAVAAEYDSIPNPTLYIDTENGSIVADGTIQDISGNNYPITNYNTSILDDGVIAFNIDNKSYLECGLDPNDSCWTAEIYFRLTDIIEQDMRIFGWGTSENKFTSKYDWDKYSFDFTYCADIEKDNFNEYIDYDTNTDFTNKFVHIMYSCDGASVIINVNGKTVITCDKLTPMTEVAKNIIIGKHYNSDKEYANMELKLFRFYNGVAFNRYQMQCNYLNLIKE